MKEYIVTTDTLAHSEQVCKEMTQLSGTAEIPYRRVHVSCSRPLSRSTHYFLTEHEATQLRNDPRIESVVEYDTKITARPMFTQQGVWDKSLSLDLLQKNWGLFRCTQETVSETWGSNLTPVEQGQVKTTAEGRNVDVVIVDGHFNPNHPEFIRDGVSRVVQYNWFQHNPEVTGAPASQYNYSVSNNSYEVDDNNHGCHVAGICCGNTQGWARQSNIYNISPYSTNPNSSLNFLLVFDYIRAWHRSKPVNPVTGRKNPTVINNSWGITWEILSDWVYKVNYRGTDYSITSVSELEQYGIVANGLFAYIPTRFPPIDADIQDAIADGIIVVGASGNESFKIDVPGGVDYNNRVYWAGSSEYYHRGSSPGAASLSLCVGSISSTAPEEKANYSNCGPRVDVYAPGTNIISSLNDLQSYVSIADPTDPANVVGKMSGSSCATPQVSGIVACILEVYPRLSQQQVVGYIQQTAIKGALANKPNTYSDYSSLQGSPNLMLQYKETRVLDQVVWPKQRYFIRKPEAVVYPRRLLIK